MTNEELKKILENHQHWLNEDTDGWQEMCANLRYANLRYANLRYADLRDADLRYANLRYADLRGADLRYADLRGADLRGADLRGADLRCADLRGADLRGADLRYADLRGAYLRGAKNIPFMPMSCPDEGGFIGWKKALVIDGTACIIKLYIPADAKRSSATGRKCRCNKAKVLSITHILSGKSYTVATSTYDPKFIYKVGEYVEVDNFDEDRFNECAPGIHFFINKQEAIDY